MSPKRPPIPISMEKQGGGEIAAKRARRTSAADAAEDRLSALPDDILVLILLRLRTPKAARTSILARRWRCVWGLLPELRFASFPEPHGFCDALDAWAVPLGYLLVGGMGAAPAESLATWLPAVARRLFGKFVLVDKDPGTPAEGDSDEVEATERGALDLPYFEEATSISLDLGFIGLAVPPAGVFARLTELSLIGVRFDGPCDLGDAVSLPRCPCLQNLTVQNARGLENLIIHSDSLRLVLLKMVRGLQQLTIAAALLEKLCVVCCFFYEQAQHPVISISVPLLKVLKWADVYDPRSMHLGKMEHLRSLCTFYLVYGPESFAQNHTSDAHVAF
ncbi:unnamed protein product [Urochloa decumbens]|uniref:F-box/LRR-repeat protein 15/At3g58940/PEG3-like LRR domain-containing protein n=1 Tax=Urochloa decumbens TaxID=240449 RepID=A0ABC9GBX3_9POAL